MEYLMKSKRARNEKTVQSTAYTADFCANFEQRKGAFDMLAYSSRGVSVCLRDRALRFFSPYGFRACSRQSRDEKSVSKTAPELPWFIAAQAARRVLVSKALTQKFRRQMAPTNLICVQARSTDISVRRVETHRKIIKLKLGISSTAGLTRYALKAGVLQGTGVNI